MGLVKAPDDSPSSEEQGFYSIDPDLSAAPADAATMHHHLGGHDRRPQLAPATKEAPSTVQLKSPTSKALKRILKSSIGLRNLMAEQQERDSLAAHSPSNTRKSMDHLWDSFPVTLPSTHHGSLGKRIDTKQRWSPPADKASKVRNERHHLQYQGRAPLTVIGLGDEIAEKESREEAMLIAEEAAKRAASTQAAARPVLRAPQPRPMETFKFEHDTSHHPYGGFETNSPATTPSEELPGWTGYAHYVQSSSDTEDLDQHGFETTSVAFQDELSPLEPSGSLLFSAIRAVKVEQKEGGRSPADTNASRTASDTSSSSSHISMSAREQRGGSLAPQTSPNALASDCGTLQEYSPSRGSRHRGHSSVSSLGMSPPAPPPSVPLPPVPCSVGVFSPRTKSTTLQVSSTTATPSTTPTPSLTPTSPSFPSTPSSPMTPARGRSVEHKALTRNGKIPEPMEWKVDSPLSAHKQQQKHRRGLKKAPSMGSLYLTEDWPTPPQRASSIVEHPWKHSGPDMGGVQHVAAIPPGNIAPPSRALGLGGLMTTVKPVRALSTCEEDQNGESDVEAVTATAEARSSTQISAQGKTESSGCGRTEDRQGSEQEQVEVKLTEQDLCKNGKAQVNVEHQQKGQHSHRHHRPGCSHHRSAKSSLPAPSFHAAARTPPIAQHNRCVSHTWDEETEVSTRARARVFHV